MKLWQTGNVGSHNIDKIKANPVGGYTSYEDAKAGMLLLREQGD